MKKIRNISWLVFGLSILFILFILIPSFFLGNSQPSNPPASQEPLWLTLLSDQIVGLVSLVTSITSLVTGVMTQVIIMRRDRLENRQKELALKEMELKLARMEKENAIDLEERKLELEEKIYARNQRSKNVGAEGSTDVTNGNAKASG